METRQPNPIDSIKAVDPHMSEMVGGRIYNDDGNTKVCIVFVSVVDKNRPDSKCHKGSAT